jgi:hypothetical protein
MFDGEAVRHIDAEADALLRERRGACFSLVLPQIPESNARARLHEPLADRIADAAGAAGDDNGSACHVDAVHAESSYLGQDVRPDPG